MSFLRLAGKLLSMEEGHFKWCTLPGHLHWVDEVRNGEWYFHGRLLAKYEPPRLWLYLVPGNPDHLYRRFDAVLCCWCEKHAPQSIISVSLYHTFMLLTVRFRNDLWGPKEWYTASDAVQLAPGEKGTALVLPPARRAEVVPLYEDRYTVTRVPHLGWIYLADDGVYVRCTGTNLLYPITIEELRIALEKTLGKRSRLARLASAAESSRELKILIELASK